MAPLARQLAALAACAFCLALQPALAAAAKPFSFGAGFGPNHQHTVAVAAGPNGDRLLVSDADYGETLTARRLVPGSRRAGPARVLDERRGTAHITDAVGLVYNPRVREYLLIYYWWGTGPGSSELLAQRIAPDGSPRGEEQPISHGRASGLDPIRPEVLYDPRTGGYLVVWDAENRSSPSLRRTIYTQRLDRSARPLSAQDTPVGEAAGGTAARQVVRDATDGSFLVLRLEESSDGTRRELVAIRIDRSGRVLGGERNLGVVRGHAFRAEYSPRARRFVIALENGRAPQSVDLRTFSRGGTRLGPALRIKAPRRAGGVDVTGLEYAARTDRLLLTWSFVDDQFHQGYFTYPRAQRVRADGRGLVGRRLAFGTGGADQPSGSTLATYDRASGQHLVLWIERDPKLDAPAFFGQLVGG